MRYCKNDTIRLRDFIYKDDGGLRLQRKYDLFQKTDKECSCNFWDYIQTKKYVKTLKLRGTKEWRDYCKSGEKPLNIPNRPSAVYKDKGWSNWSDFLGTNIS